MLYKRNQLEEAFSGLLEPKARQPSSELRTRLKRLLEIDRALGRSPRSNDLTLSQYAFFGDDPPGRGVEIQYSEYEGFALYTALQLMKHGWTQAVVVSILRRARPELEWHHARILRNETELIGVSLEGKAPVLVVVTNAGKPPDFDEEAFACAVREGYRKAMEWTWEHSKPGYGFAVFELAVNAQRLAAQLAKTEPRHRGRPG